MSAEAAAEAGPSPQALGPGGPRQTIYRHTVLVRLTHWVNAAAIFLLIGTGLDIFNAHPRLYWGAKGDIYDPALLSIHAEMGANGVPHGVLQILNLKLPTTGVLGWSRFHGQGTVRAWPAWLTLPSYPDLADARHWHLLLAWVLAGNGAVYLAWSLAIRHLQRDLWPTRADLHAIPRSIVDHLRLRHPTGADARRYNVLQRLAYLGLIACVTGMVATGLTLSPGVDAAWPWLLDLFGGRQSARTLHFVFASLIALFILVHLVEVVLAGPLNETWSMISGRYRLPRARAEKVGER